jgi:hypothetical protein
MTIGDVGPDHNSATCLGRVHQREDYVDLVIPGVTDSPLWAETLDSPSDLRSIYLSGRRVTVLSGFCECMRACAISTSCTGQWQAMLAGARTGELDV